MKNRTTKICIATTLAGTSIGITPVYAQENEEISHTEIDIEKEDVLETIGEELEEERDNFELEEDVLAELYDNNSIVKKLYQTPKLKNEVVLDYSKYKINEAVINETITIENYNSSSHIQAAGINRGNYMGREVIPYQIKAGETITVKQITGLNQADLTVELKGGLSENEKSGKISKDGSEVSVTAIEDSVIYIRTSREVGDIQLEYSITNATTLPIYTHNETDEDTFFAEWDYLGIKNAVVQSETMVIQVPLINKEQIRDLPSFGSFDDVDMMMDYYEDILINYDKFIGLDGSETWNMPSQQRYLFVPQLRYDLGDLAYYATTLIRICGEGSGVYRLFDDSWLGKHEIAHGYQGSMMDSDVRVREIWNNVPTHYYSMISKSNISGQYAINYAKQKPSNQKSVYDASVKSRVNNLAPAYSLNFFREIFDQWGLDVYTKFYQEYRRLAQDGLHDDETNTNLFSELFSRYANVDFSPYFHSFNADIKQNIEERSSELPNVWYLTDLVSDEEKLDYILSEYDLSTEYSLVDTSIFTKDEKLQDLKGNAIVNIDIDDLSELEGKQILLKNGDLEIYKEVTSDKVTFEDIPVGEYDVYLPLTNSGEYNLERSKLLTVSEGNSSETTLNYTVMKDNILNLQYKFFLRTNYGYTPMDATLSYISDDNYKLDILQNAGKIQYNGTPGEVYAWFKVLDEEGNEVAYREYKVKESTIADSKSIDVKKGYRIIMYRSNIDKGRKYYKSTISGIEYYDDDVETMEFTIGENGLEYQNHTDNTKDTIDYILSTENELTESTSQYLSNEARISLVNGLKHLSTEDKLAYEDILIKYSKNNNPIITTKSETIEVKKGYVGNFKELINISDIEDGNISNISVDSSQVDVNKLGTYEITYRVEDNDHNITTKTVKVNVVRKMENIETNTPEVKPGFDDLDTLSPVVDTERDLDKLETLTPKVNPIDEIPTTDIDADRELEGLNTLTPEIEAKIPERDLENLLPLLPTKPIIEDEDTSKENENDNEIIEEDNETDKNDKESIIKINDSIIKIVGRDKYQMFTKNIQNLKEKSSYVPTYIDKQGNRQVIKFSHYEDNSLNFLNIQNVIIDSYVDNSKTFGDIEDSWAKDYIDFASSRDILVGTGNETFAPDAPTTRAMLVTVLNRLSGEETQYKENAFTDVENEMWYTNAINWAKSEGIVDGITETTFEPNAEVTREQMAVIINNYLEYMGYDISYEEPKYYSDAEDISNWSLDSISTLKSIGIIVGDEDGNYNPKESLTRAELATISEKLVELVINLEKK